MAVLCAAVLAGCSTWEPDRTEILVQTTPPDASCVLTRLGQQIGGVASTPGIALVEPGANEIDVRCSRAGFADATATLPAPDRGLNPVALIFGGPDAEYRRQIDMTLVPR